MKCRSIWDNPILKSRTDKTNVSLWEMVFGYFLGPLGVLIMTAVVNTYFLTFYRTYDDIVSQGTFLTLLPLVSVIPMALANIIVGVLIGRTHTRQGKARPYILTAAPLLLVSGILVFCIPYLSLGFRMVWMALTYNLFAAVANPIYGTAHYLMVSLSTRDLKQRGTLSVVANIPAVAANGLISSIVMPVILSWIKSAPDNAGVQNRWQLVMVAFSMIAFIGCILEYFFTRERITEEDFAEAEVADEVKGDLAEAEADGRGKGDFAEAQANDRVKGDFTEAEADGRAEDKVPALVQIKAAVSDQYWWIVIIFYALYQAGVMFKGGFIFNIYCNEYFTDATVFGMQLNAEMIQSVLALISGIPLALGMLFIWPLANKFGKKNMILVGFLFSIAGSVICYASPANFYVVLIGQTFKGISSIPGSYIMMALFADVLDHLEARFGFRVDGVSMSVYNALITVVNGLAVAFFLFFYDNAAFDSAGVARFFFVGYEIFAHAVLFVVMSRLDVEKHIEEEQRLIADRKAKKA